MSRLSDQERAQPGRLLGLDRDVGHHGQLRAMARPLDEAVHAVGRSFEDRLDPAVGEVANPPAHTMLKGPPLARVAEVDALDPAGDEYPVADHHPAPRPAHRGGSARRMTVAGVRGRAWNAPRARRPT